MIGERLDRNIRFFGREGQARLSAARVAVVGVGGLGTHVVQQLALLGVGSMTLIDSEELERTNLNRYVGVRHDDPIPGTRKVDIGERIVKAIDPQVQVVKIFDTFVSERAFSALTAADYVFGCLDREGARLILNELCAAYCRPYIDLASGIEPGSPPSYGGHVCVAFDAEGCLVCLGQLEVAEASEDLAGPMAKQDREAIYGVRRDLLDGVGPSVVSINGVVASLGVTEFMVFTTGIRAPRRLLTYRGQMGTVGATRESPPPDCYYCKRVRGRGDAADVQRYVRAGVGAYLR